MTTLSHKGEQAVNSSGAEDALEEELIVPSAVAAEDNSNVVATIIIDGVKAKDTSDKDGAQDSDKCSHKELAMYENAPVLAFIVDDDERWNY